MRHLKHAGGKLSRTSAHRQALLRNLLTSLLKNGSIQTTASKAKLLRRFVEPIVEMGKSVTWQAKRRVRETVQDKEAMNNLFTVYGPRFKDRLGGYTRIFRLGPRLGDGAEMSMIELLPDPSKENEPRRIKTKHQDETEQGEATQKNANKKEKDADSEKRRETLKLKAENKRISNEKDIQHAHTSQRRKTEKGTGRSKSTKKGLS